MSASNTSCQGFSCLRHGWWLAGVVVLAALVGLLYLATRPDPASMLSIVDGSIYRTPAGLIVADPNAWQASGVQQVLLLVSADPQRRERRGLGAYEVALEQSGLQVHRLIFPDNAQGDAEDFAAALAIVQQARELGQPIVIHCAAGMHRATAVEVMVRSVILGEPPSKLDDLMRLRGLTSHQSRIAAHLRAMVQTSGESDQP